MRTDPSLHISHKACRELTQLLASHLLRCISRPRRAGLVEHLIACVAYTGAWIVRAADESASLTENSCTSACHSRGDCLRRYSDFRTLLSLLAFEAVFRCGDATMRVSPLESPFANAVTTFIFSSSKSSSAAKVSRVRVVGSVLTGADVARHSSAWV